MVNEIFGRDGNRLYVNSADNIGVTSLEDYIDGISARGAVDIRVIHEMISEQESVEIDDVVVGNVAIRKYIEEAGACARNNRRVYGKRQANKLKKKADFIQTLFVSSGYSLKWTLTTSLDAFVEAQAESGRNAHRMARKTCEEIDMLDEY